MKKATSFPSPTWASAVPGQAPLSAQPARCLQQHLARLSVKVAIDEHRNFRIFLPGDYGESGKRYPAIAAPITPNRWRSVSRNMPAMAL